MPAGRIAIILNGGSLRKFPRGLAERLRSAAGDSGREVSLETSRSLEHLIELTGAAIHSGAEWILCGGGDGTLHHIVNHTEVRRVAVAPLPLGTVNAWLRAVRVNVGNPVAALQELLGGHEVEGFLGRVNERRFACFASWGFDARVVHGHSGGLKKLIGKWAYGVAGVRELIHARERAVPGSLSVAGETMPASTVIAAKIPNYAGVEAFSARFDQRRLELLLSRSDSPLGMLALTTYLARRGPARGLPAPNRVRHLESVTSAEWTAACPTALQIDGEASHLSDSARLCIQCESHPQRFIVPG